MDDYLRDCARTFLRCRDFAAKEGMPDPRVGMLLHRLSVSFGMSHAECERRIEQIADGQAQPNIFDDVEAILREQFRRHFGAS
jgi:hypothetical protein